MTPDTHSVVNDQTEGSKKFSFRRIVFYLVSLAVLVAVYLKFAEFDQLERAFLDSNKYLLALAIVLQAGTYWGMALNYKFVLKMKGLAIQASELYPLMFIVQFLNQALPSAGISGQVFFIDYLKKKGMTLAEGFARVILELTTLYMGFGLLFMISAFLGVQQERLGHPEIAYFIYTFLVIASFFLLVFLVFQKQTGIGWLHRFVERFQKKSQGDKQKGIALFLTEISKNVSVEVLRKVRGAFTLAILAQLGVLMLDILTVYVLAIAIGVQVSFGVVFIVFTLTQFASMISFVPGSLGVFEGSMSLLFIGFGMASPAALTLTFLFRGIIFWLPMPIGWIIYRYYEKKMRLTA